MVNRRLVRLVLWRVTVRRLYHLCILPSDPGQLSPAIPRSVGKISTGDSYGHHFRKKRLVTYVHNSILYRVVLQTDGLIDGRADNLLLQNRALHYNTMHRAVERTKSLIT